MAAGRDWSPHAIGSFSLGRWAGDVLHLAGIVACTRAAGAPSAAMRTFRTMSPPISRGTHLSGSPGGSNRRPDVGDLRHRAPAPRERAPFAESHRPHVGSVHKPHDFPGYHRVRKATFPEDPPPATVVEIKELLPTAETLLEIQITASRELPRNLLKNPV